MLVWWSVTHILWVISHTDFFNSRIFIRFFVTISLTKYYLLISFFEHFIQGDLNILLCNFNSWMSCTFLSKAFFLYKLLSNFFSFLTGYFWLIDIIGEKLQKSLRKNLIFLPLGTWFRVDRFIWKKVKKIETRHPFFTKRSTFSSHSFYHAWVLANRALPPRPTLNSASGSLSLCIWQNLWWAFQRLSS